MGTELSRRPALCCIADPMHLSKPRCPERQPFPEPRGTRARGKAVGPRRIHRRGAATQRPWNEVVQLTAATHIPQVLPTERDEGAFFWSKVSRRTLTAWRARPERPGLRGRPKHVSWHRARGAQREGEQSPTADGAGRPTDQEGLSPFLSPPGKGATRGAGVPLAYSHIFVDPS